MALFWITPAWADWPLDRWFFNTNLETLASTILSESIQIPTVNPPGNEAALAKEFARLLEHRGIEAKVIPTPSPDGGPARAAVWGRLPGKSRQAGARGIVLLSHLDTVPANASQWSVDPFAGQIAGQAPGQADNVDETTYVWGRGALDAKGVSVTHLLTLVELARSQSPLEGDVIFLATPDEETGGLDGAGWIAKHHPELFAGTGFLLTEGGGIQAAVPGQSPSVWGVTLTEKAPCWIELRAHGRAGHSSAPAKDAAVPRLIAALDRVRRFETRVQVKPEVADMFAALAPIANEWDRPAFKKLAVSLDEDPAFRRRFLDNPSQNALVRNTISITVLEGAQKTNIAPALARAQLDVRLLPGESCERFAGRIEELIDEPSIEIATLLNFPAAASSSDSSLYRAIAAVAARQPEPAVVVPRMIGGFTDAHWFRELGLVAYGFVPRTLARKDARRIHGIDERAPTESLAEGIRLTIDVLREFDAAESAQHAN